MLRSIEGQPIAPGIAMLALWTQAIVHVHRRARTQDVAQSQVDVLARR